VLPADWRRYVAPAAFLLAATIAVVLIRSGVEAGGSRHPTTVGGAPAPRKHVVATTSATTTKASPKKRFWIVGAGDTFAVISSKSGVPVATIVRLNPKAHSTSLFIGERIRLR
jgi:LysM repeat protein